MATTTIDMRPQPFELPFFYEQLDTLAKNRLNLWMKRKRTLGDGSIFGYSESGMQRSDEGDLYATAGYPRMTKHLEDALHQAKDFIEYHERHADKHGGLKLGDCHEWGNARSYDGGKWQPRALQYGIRLSFNDGTVRFFTITSKPMNDL